MGSIANIPSLPKFQETLKLPLHSSKVTGDHYWVTDKAIAWDANKSLKKTLNTEMYGTVLIYQMVHEDSPKQTNRKQFQLCKRLLIQTKTNLVKLPCGKTELGELRTPLVHQWIASLNIDHNQKKVHNWSARCFSGWSYWSSS